MTVAEGYNKSSRGKICPLAPVWSSSIEHNFRESGNGILEYYIELVHGLCTTHEVVCVLEGALNYNKDDVNYVRIDRMSGTHKA
jgi:hypothetical protein